MRQLPIVLGLLFLALACRASAEEPWWLEEARKAKWTDQGLLFERPLRKAGSRGAAGNGAGIAPSACSLERSET